MSSPPISSGSPGSSLSEAERVAACIQAALTSVKIGSLRFWGEWFGRPYDNWHRAVACDAKDSILRIQFNEGELLQIWSPSEVTLESETFKIQAADRVRWEWFYYGRPKVDENRYFMDFTRLEDTVTASTNVDWYTPNLRPTLSAPAVEIL